MCLYNVFSMSIVLNKILIIAVLAGVFLPLVDVVYGSNLAAAMVITAGI